MLQDFTDKFFGDSKTNEKQTIGIGGWTAEVRTSENIQFTSDVPDNYIEDGSVINDHIINNPIVLSIDGEVSDIHIKAEFLSDTFFKYLDKAESVLNLFPSHKTIQMTQRLNTIAIGLLETYKQVDSILDRGKGLFDMFEDKSETSLQKGFFDYLNRIYYSKELIEIEMPFQTYKNMRITSLTISRDNSTNQAVKYKITAKEVRFAKTILVKEGSNYFTGDNSVYYQNPSSSTNSKTSSKKNKGITEGTKTEQSFLYTVTH